jgi:hypothetical protein
MTDEKPRLGKSGKNSKNAALGDVIEEPATRLF